MTRKTTRNQGFAAGIGLALGVGLLTLGVSQPAHADAPVSVGRVGAIERSALTQSAGRKGSAATFGQPAFDESRGFGFRLRIPFFVSGAEADDMNAIVPFQRTKTVVLQEQQNFLGNTGFLSTNEDLRKFQSYIPAIEIGEERKALHVQLGALSQRVGHGSIVHWFTNSPEGGERKFGGLLELNSASLGAQLMMGDIFSPGSFAAGRVYGRPILWFISPDSLLHPNDLDLDPRSEIAGIWSTGISAAVDGYAPQSPDQLRDDFGIVYAAGWDNEIAVLDNKAIRAMVYLDLNLMGGPRDGLATPIVNLPFGVGAHPGFRLDLDLPIAVDLNIEAEYNVGSDGYTPRYFDRIYFLERELVLGTGRSGQSPKSKASLVAPASHGFNLKASANIIKTFSVWVEARDQFPFDWNRGSNAGGLTAGGSFFFMFFGGNVTLSKAGISNYTQPGFMGPGFIFTAEGRVALVANVFHIVARYYRVHDPVDINLQNTDFNVVEGSIVGLEINFDLNTPFPLF